MFDSNDHRFIAQRLDLFHFQEEAPGMVFWHPRGLFLQRVLEESVRKHALLSGYEEVRTPQIMRKSLWQSSGHWEHFYDNMFKLPGDSGQPEEAVKPVNCPGHVCLFAARNASYRDLPKRYAEFGLVHRDERSGSLHGLLRLRQFTQDDGHVFCTEEQAEGEVLAFCRSVRPFYEGFGFKRVSLVLATRPEQRAGDDASWDRSEDALRRVLAELGEPYREEPGSGAFYGPKLEYVLEDQRGRSWTCGTIQFDLVMPDAFGVHYIDANGARRRPVMLHRALYGSLERFLGILLEQHGASLPAWLAPVQVKVLPVASAHAEFAERVLQRLARHHGLRVELDARDETLGKRVAEARELGVPFVAVVGAREVERGSVTLRSRDGSQQCLPLESAAPLLSERCRLPENLLAPR